MSYWHRCSILLSSVTLSSAESEKKNMKAYHDCRACFTPLCVSVDGMFGVDTEFFLKCLGDYLAMKWEHPFSVIMCWIRARLSFSILRATMLCVCGPRTKWRCLGIIDGMSLSLTVDWLWTCNYLILCVVLFSVLVLVLFSFVFVFPLFC